MAAALAQRVGIPVDASAAEPDPADTAFTAALSAVLAGDVDSAAAQTRELPQHWAGRTLIEGLVAEHRGELVESTRLLSAALTTADEHQELWLEVASALVRVAFNAGNVSLAIETGEAALSLPPTSLRSEDLAITIRAALSGVYCDSGNLARARELTEDESVQALTPWQRGTQLWARSIVANVDGRIQDASRLATDALRLFRQSDRPLSIARLQVNAAMLHMQSPGFDASAVLDELRSAEDTFRSLRSPFDLAGCLTARARISAYRDHGDEARLAIMEAIDLVREEGMGMRARIYASAGLTYLALGDRANADAHLLEARSLLEGAGANRAAASTWRHLAAAYEELGQLDLALACMKAATDLLGVHAQPNAAAPASV